MKPYLSIVIKTFNEEGKIAKAIESALKVKDEIGKSLQIVVADSLSADRTIQIASSYPATVVQFTNPDERGCGAGVELGFRYATGEFLYFLDGDMEIADGFFTEALLAMKKNPHLAGVGGSVIDTQVANAFDRIRVNNKSVSNPGPANWLEGGGLYRRSAIEKVGGYAADRNLKGYEEAELGMRLRAAGWELLRLPRIAATHTGHAQGTWSLLARHWRSGRAMSGGVLLRGSLGKPWFFRACRMLIHPIATALWWLALPLSLGLSSEYSGLILSAWLTAFPIIFIALAIRKRDIHHAAISIATWHYGALATAIGIFANRISPTGKMSVRVVQDISTTSVQPLS